MTLHDLDSGAHWSGGPLPALGTLAGPASASTAGPSPGSSTPTTPRCNPGSTPPRHLGVPALQGHAPGRLKVPAVPRGRSSTRRRTAPSCGCSCSVERGARPAAPTILYGYGGFGISLTPGFSAAILAWLEAGGVYAVANLRGGGEYGEEWHRAGMLEQKQNVFDDFIAAAEWLDREQVHQPRPAGDLRRLQRRPARRRRDDPAPRPLTRAVVCAAPLLDMVRYHPFGCGRTWIVEYGTAEEPEQFDWLLAYSPYHHVKPGTRYPALLSSCSDNDNRVDPMHARKMCAALQHATRGRGRSCCGRRATSATARARCAATRRPGTCSRSRPAGPG